jgi:zinc transport system permease protein
MNFFDYSEFWLPVVCVSAATAAAASAGGVQLLTRRAVFLPAALAQASALGVVLCFLAGHRWGLPLDRWFMDPFLWAVAAGVLASLGLSQPRERGVLTRDWLLGAVFVLASSGILLLGSLVPQETHDIQGLLSGSGVALGAGDATFPVVTSALVLGFHLLLLRPLSGVAFDPAHARVQGLPVGLLEGALFVLLGVGVAASTKVSGSIPAFAFSIFPPLAALALVRNFWWVVPVAAALGAAGSFLGYWFAFQTGLPAGASMAAMVGVMALVGLGISAGRRARWGHQARRRECPGPSGSPPGCRPGHR